jgi:hypothetical protein
MMSQSLPPETRRSEAWCGEARALASDKRFNVMHLAYLEKEWDSLA